MDDEPGFSELVKEFLEIADSTFSIQCATCVDDAMSILHNAEVDCIVSDYDMPGEDGIEFLERVREEYPNIPFVLFTGYGSEDIASEAISAGVTEYQQKESGTDQYKILANRIRNLVQSARAEATVNRTDECYHNLAETTPIPICLFDEEGRIVYSNEATVKFLNANSDDELEGVHFLEFLHPEDSDIARQHFDLVVRDGQSIPEPEFRMQTIDGEIKSVTVSSTHGYYHGEEVVQTIVHQ